MLIKFLPLSLTGLINPSHLFPSAKQTIHTRTAHALTFLGSEFDEIAGRELFIQQPQ